MHNNAFQRDGHGVTSFRRGYPHSLRSFGAPELWRYVSSE